jgi:ribosomal protein S18 acetylase RimI-like enzyme
MAKKTIEQLQVVRQSDIQPEILQNFFTGYIYENANKDPYKYTDELEQLYPDFKKWFITKVKPGLCGKIPERELILLIAPDSGSIAGFAILKKTGKESKICTFRISEGWRNGGAGQKLMKACLKYLDTDKPLITVSEKCKGSFEKIFKQFNFVQTQEICDLYVTGSKEYVYNGYLDSHNE